MKGSEGSTTGSYQSKKRYIGGLNFIMVRTDTLSIWVRKSR